MSASENDGPGLGLENLFSIDSLKASLKRFIKKNMMLVMMIVFLVLVGPYAYMYSMGYSYTQIGMYYLGGIIVVFVLFSMFNSMGTKKPSNTKEGMLAERAKHSQKIKEIDEKLGSSIEEEEKALKLKLKEIEAAKENIKKGQ